MIIALLKPQAGGGIRGWVGPSAGTRAGKFSLSWNFFRRPFGEVKINFFFCRRFLKNQESIKTDVFQNAKNTMILKVFASTMKAVQKRNEFKRFLHSVLHGRIVQKPQENKGFCDIRFQKYYDFQCFWSILMKNYDSLAFWEKNFAFGGPKKSFNFFS